MRVVFLNFFMRLFADIEPIVDQTTTSTTPTSTTTTSTTTSTTPSQTTRPNDVDEIVSIPSSNSTENSAIEKFRKFQAAQK